MNVKKNDKIHFKNVNDLIMDVGVRVSNYRPSFSEFGSNKTSAEPNCLVSQNYCCFASYVKYRPTV